jgi:hypothetical protein
MTKVEPIFIHSLFRAGSTYLFTAFRRAGKEYTCYQEPLHEIAVFARNNVSILDQAGGEMNEFLRHPSIDGSYYKELIDAWPTWTDFINENSVYNGYFSESKDEIGVPYWAALTENSTGRPVFQECRTSSRINAIKKILNGEHIYLWRNPWDQWWSYKVAPYFDVTSQIIIHAQNSPQPVHNLLKELQLKNCGTQDLDCIFSYYYDNPLTTEQSYLIFYLLWCLGLKEGQSSADLLINIDSLSTSNDYKQEIESYLNFKDIHNIYFYDCSIPQTTYTSKESVFFQSLEAKVHSWLLDGGWHKSDLDRIQSMRLEHQPSNLVYKQDNEQGRDLLKQSSRARDLVSRYEKVLFDRTVYLKNKFEETRLKSEITEKNNKELIDASIKDLETIKKLNLDVKLTKTQEHQNKEQLQQALSLAQIEQAKANHLNQQLSQAHAQEQQTKDQLRQALSLAQIAQAKADHFSQQLSQAHAQDQQTKDQLQQALSLALAMKSQGIEQAQQLQQMHQQALIKHNAEALAQITQVQAELDHLHQCNHQHRSELENKQQELHDTQQANQHLLLHTHALQKQIEALHKSWSWTITAPLRWGLLHLLRPLVSWSTLANIIIAWTKIRIMSILKIF